MDQGIRPATAAAYPFIMPGQYVTQMQYPQQVRLSPSSRSLLISLSLSFPPSLPPSRSHLIQLSALGTPLAPNAAIQPNSGKAPQYITTTAYTHTSPLLLL